MYSLNDIISIILTDLENGNKRKAVQSMLDNNIGLVEVLNYKHLMGEDMNYMQTFELCRLADSMIDQLKDEAMPQPRVS